MKIAFWSPFHGQCGTTSNLMAVTLIATLLSEYNTALLQTSFKLNGLEHSLIGKQTKVIGEFFNDTGIDAISRAIKSEPLTYESIVNCSISLVDERIHMIPATYKVNREHYEAKLLPVLDAIISALNKDHELVCIDTNAGLYDELTNRVLNTADMIVINLNQNKYLLDTFFETNPFEEKNVFYIIGNYDPESKYTINNIKRQYKGIKSDSIGAIPYWTGYKDAMISANVYDYFNRTLNSRKVDRDYEFMKIAKETTMKIMKKANMSRGMKNDTFV